MLSTLSVQTTALAVNNLFFIDIMFKLLIIIDLTFKCPRRIWSDSTSQSHLHKHGVGLKVDTGQEIHCI